MSPRVSEYDFSIRTSCLLSELFFQEEREVLNSNSHYYMLQIFSCLPALCTWREHSNARLVSRFPIRSANFCEKTGQWLRDLMRDTKLILCSEKGSLRGCAHCQIIPLAIQTHGEKMGLVFGERGWKNMKAKLSTERAKHRLVCYWKWFKTAFRIMLGEKHHGKNWCKKTCAVEQKEAAEFYMQLSLSVGAFVEIYIIYCAVRDQAWVKRKIQQRTSHSGWWAGRKSVRTARWLSISSVCALKCKCASLLLATVAGLKLEEADAVIWWWCCSCWVWRITSRASNESRWS